MCKPILGQDRTMGGRVAATDDAGRTGEENK